MKTSDYPLVIIGAGAAGLGASEQASALGVEHLVLEASHRTGGRGLTEYLEGAQHPGGEDVILEYLGYDATLAFRGVNHSRSTLRVLDKYCIGILPANERLNFSSD